jgi:hypothetical protein
MFPPGSRRLQVRAEPRHPEPDGDEGVPDDAFIMPDEPIRRSEPAAAEAWSAPPEPEEPVTVTGIGERPPLARGDLAPAASTEGDPHVAEVMRVVKRLADALAAHGEAALRTTPDMTPFEATLRAYCVGFLAAERRGREG